MLTDAGRVSHLRNTPRTLMRSSENDYFFEASSDT